MKFLEKDLEKIIYEADRVELRKKGLTIEGKLLRQVKIGNYGICDLMSIKRRATLINVTIFELKKEKVSVSTYLQAIGYARGVESYLSKRGFFAVVNIVLIGRTIDKESTFCYLPYFNEMLSIYTYDYGINGIRFQNTLGYELRDEGFNESKFKNS